MNYYPYSRKAHLRKAISIYEEGLESGTIPPGDFGYHALCSGSFAGETNRKARALIEGLSAPQYPFAGAKDIPSSESPEMAGKKTEEILASAFRLLASGEGAPERAVEYLLSLLGRFEVTGRLYESYEPGLRKGIGGYSNVRNYVFLAACLILLYRTNGSLKILNAVLKLNDLIVFLMEEAAELGPLALLVFSLAEEEKEVERLYDFRGFRLPSH